MWDTVSEKNNDTKYRIITNSLRVQKLVIYIAVIRLKRTDFLCSYHCEIHPRKQWSRLKRVTLDVYRKGMLDFNA